MLLERHATELTVGHPIKRQRVVYFVAEVIVGILREFVAVVFVTLP